jgi:hypothetical protein
MQAKTDPTQANTSLMQANIEHQFFESRAWAALPQVWEFAWNTSSSSETVQISKENGRLSHQVSLQSISLMIWRREEASGTLYQLHNGQQLIFLGGSFNKGPLTFQKTFTPWALLNKMSIQGHKLPFKQLP